MLLAFALGVNLLLIYFKAWLLMLLNGWAHSSQENVPAFGWKFWVAVMIAHFIVKVTVSTRVYEFRQADLD